jgi:hypothetical protein
VIESGVLVNSVFQPGASIRFSTGQTSSGSGARRLLTGSGNSINITSDAMVINSALEVQGAATFTSLNTSTLIFVFSSC